MKMKFKGLMLGLAAFAMAISAVVSAAEPAGATGPCGSSYVLVGSHPMWDGNARGGTLQVYWSNTYKRNCAVAMCYDSTCGYGVYRDVRIKRTGDSTWNDTDAGWNWVSYAGPVYSYNSAGRCIDVYARFYVGANNSVGTANVQGKYCG